MKRLSNVVESFGVNDFLYEWHDKHVEIVKSYLINSLKKEGFNVDKGQILFDPDELEDRIVYQSVVPTSIFPMSKKSRPIFYIGGSIEIPFWDLTQYKPSDFEEGVVVAHYDTLLHGTDPILEEPLMEIHMLFNRDFTKIQKHKHIYLI